MEYILTQGEMDKRDADVELAIGRSRKFAKLLAEAKEYPCMKMWYCGGCEIENECPLPHSYGK